MVGIVEIPCFRKVVLANFSRGYIYIRRVYIQHINPRDVRVKPRKTDRDFPPSTTSVSGCHVTKDTMGLSTQSVIHSGR